MSNLRIDESGCASENKTESMCRNCKRNLNLDEASGHELWSDFKTKKKIVDGKWTTICEGHIE